jgi:hypothetical protein
MIDADGQTCNSRGHDETAQLLCLVCLNLDGVCPAGRNFHGPAYLRRVIDWHRADLIRDLPIAGSSFFKQCYGQRTSHSPSNLGAAQGRTRSQGRSAHEMKHAVLSGQYR